MVSPWDFTGNRFKGRTVIVYKNKDRKAEKESGH